MVKCLLHHTSQSLPASIQKKSTQVCQFPSSRIRQNGMAKQNVVIAIDNSKACLKAVDFAVKNFSKDTTAFELLHVQCAASPMLIGCADAAMLAYDDLAARNEEADRVTHYFLERMFIPRLKAKGAQVHTTIVKCNTDDSGSIGQAICDYAQKHEPAALVMMKEENKGAIARFFVGSVTRYCATHSKVPVVIVPEDSEEPPAGPAAEPAQHSPAS